MTIEHAPTPYRLEKTRDGIEILADNGTLIYSEDFSGIPSERGSNFAEQIIHEQLATAAFIVRACNSHAALVAAVQGLLAASDPTWPTAWRHDRPVAAAKAALRLAGLLVVDMEPTTDAALVAYERALKNSTYQQGR